MIIKLRKVNHTQKQRSCGSCDGAIMKGDQSIYLFGAACYGDKPYSVWLHPLCATGRDVKQKLDELEEKK